MATVSTVYMVTLTQVFNDKPVVVANFGYQRESHHTAAIAYNENFSVSQTVSL